MNNIMNNINDLPLELIGKIISIVPYHNKIELVSKRWNHICNNPDIKKKRNPCVCLLGYPRNWSCKGFSHPCICNKWWLTQRFSKRSLAYWHEKACKSSSHYCVCTKGPFYAKYCRAKLHPCICVLGNNYSKYCKF